MDEFVEYETVVKSNFLSKPRFNHALLISLGFLSICFIFSNIYWGEQYPIAKLLQATPHLVFEEHQYWRLITSCLIHGDLNHLLSNAFMLTLMGYYVSAFYGVLLFPLLSLLMGALTNYFVLLNFDDPNTSIVGASGIVYYLWGFWLSLYLCIQRHVTLNRRFMKITAISIVVLIPSQFQANVSYLAHAVGFGLGVFSALLYFLINKRFIFSFEQKEIVEKKYLDFESEVAE
jgi:membrane associated rhomboid family serine protease